MKKKLLYLTTNGTWGGSEILWSLSAKRFLKKGWEVKAGGYMDFSCLKDILKIPANYLDLKERYLLPGFVQRQIEKITPEIFGSKDLLRKELKNNRPGLVIISQGNNKDGLGFMQLCADENIPFVNIIQLVSESIWPGLDDDGIDQLNLLFDKAAVNYFVSDHTRQMHEKILGIQLLNAKIAYNPFSKYAEEEILYPPTNDGHYKIALAGRLENFHKGYDLLIDVIKEDKWQQRNLSFSIFGKGPHQRLLQRMVQQQHISNISIYPHENDIASIWKAHHLLLMPSRMEGQSLSLIEAMRFKRAVVATMVGGVNELIEDNSSGFIAEYATVAHIDEALERAWAARANWQQMGETAYEHVNRKHPQDAVGYFNDEIETLLSRNLTTL